MKSESDVDPLTEKKSAHRPLGATAAKRTDGARGAKSAPVLPDRVFAALPDGPKRYIAAKPLARFIPDVTKKVFQKHGFSSAALVADWAEIVGQSLAKQCLPERLNWPRISNRAAHQSGEPTHRPSVNTQDTAHTRPTGATLVLRTDAAFALEIEYASAQIMDRINAYFGYRAITTLKIVQGPLFDTSDGHATITPRRRSRHDNPDVARAVDATISEIEDEALKSALAKLRQSVLADG